MNMKQNITIANGCLDQSAVGNGNTWINADDML